MVRLSGAFLVAVAVLVPARSARAEKITIMVGGIEKQIYLPAKLAEQLGYFKEQGLDVELLTEPAGVQAENAMLAGEVQGVVGFYDHSIDLQSKGKFVESIVPSLRVKARAFFARERIEVSANAFHRL